MSSWACVLGVMTSQHVSLSNTNWASGFSPTIRSPNNVDGKSTEERPHQQKSTPTLPTHKHTDKRTRPWRVKGASPRSLALIASERITSPEKSIRPECVQPCKEVWIKVALLYLEGLGWINATQRLAGPPPPFPHIWLSKTCQCWPRLHSVILKERRLTYSVCAAVRTSLWSDTKAFDAQTPPRDPHISLAQRQEWHGLPLLPSSTASFVSEEMMDAQTFIFSVLSTQHFWLAECLTTWCASSSTEADLHILTQFSLQTSQMFVNRNKIFAYSKTLWFPKGSQLQSKVIHTLCPSLLKLLSSRPQPIFKRSLSERWRGGRLPSFHHLTWVCPSARTNSEHFPGFVFTPRRGITSPLGAVEPGRSRWVALPKTFSSLKLKDTGLCGGSTARPHAKYRLRNKSFWNSWLQHSWFFYLSNCHQWGYIKHIGIWPFHLRVSFDINISRYTRGK